MEAIRLDNDRDIAGLFEAWQHAKSQADYHTKVADELKAELESMIDVPLARIGQYEVAKVEPTQLTKWDGKYLAQLVVDIQATQPELAQRIMEACTFTTRRGYTRIGLIDTKHTKEH